MYDPSASARVSLPRHRDEDFSEARKIVDRARAWRSQNKVHNEKGRQGLHGAKNELPRPSHCSALKGNAGL